MVRKPLILERENLGMISIYDIACPYCNKIIDGGIIKNPYDKKEIEKKIKTQADYAIRKHLPNCEDYSE